MVFARFSTSCDSTGVRLSHHPCNTHSKDRSRSLNDSAARSLALAVSSPWDPCPQPKPVYNNVIPTIMLFLRFLMTQPGLFSMGSMSPAETRLQ